MCTEVDINSKNAIMTYVAVSQIIDRFAVRVSNTVHGQNIDGSTSDGGTYSRGSSILTYVAILHIVD